MSFVRKGKLGLVLLTGNSFEERVRSIKYVYIFYKELELSILVIIFEMNLWRYECSNVGINFFYRVVKRDEVNMFRWAYVWLKMLHVIATKM